MRTSGAPYRENAKLYPAVIACDKREAFALGSVATKQSVLSSCREVDCFASLAMTIRVIIAPKQSRQGGINTGSDDSTKVE